MAGLELQSSEIRDVFKEALVAGLIHDGNSWSEAQRMRNLSSHTYDEKPADQVYGFVKDRGDQLFQELANEVRQWDGAER